MKKSADGGEDRNILTGDSLLILLLGLWQMKTLPAASHQGRVPIPPEPRMEIRLIAISPPLPGPAPDVTSGIFPQRVEADPLFAFTNFI